MGVWQDEHERCETMASNLNRIRLFRAKFAEFQDVIPSLSEAMPNVVAKLYSDCQQFAETEIRSLLQKIEEVRAEIED